MNATVRLLVLCAMVLTACSAEVDPADQTTPEEETFSALLLQTCTAVNIRRQPIKGTLCGGTSHAFGCTPGVLYNCNDKSLTGNCTLATVCANGCRTDGLRDTCFAGATPLVLGASSPTGGVDERATVTLSDAHPRSNGIVNMRIDRGDLIAARFSCNVQDIPPGVPAVSFDMPTAVVSAPTPVAVYTDIAYIDASGVGRELASPAITVTLQPGGTAKPPPPIASFEMTPSTIGPGGISFADVVLQQMAPIPGVSISMASSDPAIAALIPNGVPFVQPGCTAVNLVETVEAALDVASNTTVTMSASSGAPGQAPVTAPLLITSGCTPKTCDALPMPFCTGDDGCGGTLHCGCNFGQTCGGGGTPGVCGDPPPPPPPLPATSAQLTVVATGRSGVTVSSNPAGLSLTSGQSASAGFPVGTQVTLSAGGGRTVFWSGACSTSRDTPSCTFTLNADASVTANIH